MACAKKGCTGFALPGSEFCHKHGGRVTAVTVVYGYCLIPVGGGVDVNEDFRSRSDEKLSKKAIDNFMGKGPSGASKAYSVKGVMLSHDTCGAGTGNHASVFFTWSGNMMHVYALGYHPGSNLKEYELMWYDGTTFSWTRP